MFGLQEIRYMNSVMGSGRRNALTKAQVRERYPHALKIIRAANNSWKIEHVDRVTFVHIATRVVTVFPDGSVVLNSGGWRTVTTKNRLNRFQSLGRVYSDKGRWYVRAWIDGGWINHPFVDGMKIKPGGIAIYPDPEAGLPSNRRG